jgi:hypothetical protein
MDLISQDFAQKTSEAIAEKLAQEIAAGTSQESPEHLSRALGEAVVRIWGYLPRDVQCRLFNETLNTHQGRMRPQLASLLHGKHPRTSGARQARAMLEPDSLGG